MKKQADLKCVMLVQQLKPEFWIGWDEEIIKKVQGGDIRLLIEELIRRFENGGCEVEEAYGIVHDKDEISVWNTTEMKNIVEFKEKHVHLLFKFGKGLSLNNLALLAGVEPQYLEKSKSGRYGYDNILAYLIHAKDDKKYQYSPKNVVTVRGEDYLSVYNRRMETWIRGRATKEAKETNFSVDFLISEIIAGKISKSQVLLTNELYKIYALHKRKINEAFETAGENKSYRTMSDLENGNFKKTVIFIYADSGQGKTRFSKEIITAIQTAALKYDEARWDFCLTASTNSFDDYNGQDILFLDDIRGDSLTVSDWLKLLDPFTISPISARYHNKMGSAKVIIITSTKHPIEFFGKAKGNFKEDLGQFVRRIDLLVQIEDEFVLSSPIKCEKENIPQNRAKKENVQYQYSENIVKTLVETNKSVHYADMYNLYSHKFQQINRVKKRQAKTKILSCIKKNMKWNTRKTKSSSDNKKQYSTKDEKEKEIVTTPLTASSSNPSDTNVDD